MSSICFKNGDSFLSHKAFGKSEQKKRAKCACVLMEGGVAYSLFSLLYSQLGASVSSGMQKEANSAVLGVCCVSK